MNPDVVVTIEFGFKTLWALFYGWLYRRPVILASEGTVHTEGHVGTLKKLVRKLIVSQCARFWSNGPDSSELLVSYGADPRLIDEGMTGIDCDDWRNSVLRKLLRRDEIRKKWNLRGKVLLYSGSLTPRKGIVPFLHAVEQWQQTVKNFDYTLLLLGGGELEKEIDEWRANNPCINVVMPGFVQPEDLPPFFAAADWAVLPTLDDNWPLATLETLVAGLPQLFSCYNGATADLCRAETGVKFDPLDPQDFVRALREFESAPDGRIPDAIVQEISSYYSAEQQAERAMLSVRKVVSER
jgi:glycosyltransferase involved in cell wall biosynthesis